MVMDMTITTPAYVSPMSNAGPKASSTRTRRITLTQHWFILPASKGDRYALSCHSSYHAIWMASSLASFEALGSSTNIGSWVT